VNIASTVVLGSPGRSTYAAAKAALVSFTRSWARWSSTAARSQAARLTADHALVRDHHWWDYFRSLARGQGHAKYMLDYYRRRWNTSHPPGRRAVAIVAHLATQRAYPESREIAWKRNWFSHE
jgi:NAD(P)-dependent dehydrogenase (short-subunit alcohol dehydrogenase family)